MKTDKVWTDLERYIKIIHDEIRTAKPDQVTVDFYLFKIERRIKILKDYLNEKSSINT
jgi:hypothetical protein